MDKDNLDKLAKEACRAYCKAANIPPYTFHCLPDCEQDAWRAVAKAAEEEMVPFEFHQNAIRHLENNFKQEHARLNAEIAELKQRRFVRFTNEECWIFQGDGTDNLESLVCPVVIRADVLKRIIDMAEPDH